MQRFLRDPRGHMSETSLSDAYGQRIALIRKHFAPGVAAVYAIPQLSADGVLEWWTSQQGMVTPYAALNNDAQQALLRAYDAHLATLDGLVEAMRARGMTEQAGQIQALRIPPALDKLYSVDGRPLVRLQDDPAPPPGPVARPAPPPRGWWRIAAGGLLLLAAILGALWWWILRPATPLPLVAAPEPKPAPIPKPEPEPERDSQWPTELVVVLETSGRMKAPPARAGGPARWDIGRGEVERIVGSLPPDTNTQLVTFPPGECRPPEGHGVFSQDKRPDLLKVVQGAQNQGKAALADGLKLAAASVDGVKRDALVFVFVGGDDACGQDICAVSQQIAQEKPRLRINIVDLSGTQSVATCLAKQTRVGSYAWGNWKREGKGIDLSKEAARMLTPASDAGKASGGAASTK